MFPEDKGQDDAEGCSEEDHNASDQKGSGCEVQSTAALPHDSDVLGRRCVWIVEEANRLQKAFGERKIGFVSFHLVSAVRPQNANAVLDPQ